ncbi:MAG: hypothetical protein DA408_09610 [Bacteroidetes bacterium]|nr:MAG: hypothetical protein DA408_09610 [Bacteroidota bacterium]
MLLTSDPESAYAWLKSLLDTGQATLALDPSTEQETLLWHLFWQQRAARRTRGQQVLYFSYPYFLPPEPAAEPVALLRWPCVLAPPETTRRHWLLRTDSDRQPTLNAAWCHWVASQYPHDWWAQLQRCLQPGPQALETLGAFALALAEHTPWQMSTVQPALTTTSSFYTADASAGVGNLAWIARLGLLTNNWSSPAGLPNYWRETLAYEDSVIDDLSLPALSPTQYQAFWQVYGNKYVLVEGRLGTGKSESVLELIKLCLWQGKSCLVVAREKSSLVNLQQALANNQLEDLSFLWQDGLTDLPILEGLVKSFDKSATYFPAYDALQWRTDLTRLNRTQRQLDELYQASRQQVFGNKNWTELLGDYLRVSRRQGKELLASQLNVNNYQFTPAEYQDILQAIELTQPLHEELGSVQHPLSNLSAAIFIHQDLEESEVFIRQTTERLMGIARPLHERFVRRQSRYADQLAAHHEAYYLQLRTRLVQLEEQLEDSENAFGADTLRSGDRTLKLYGQFSDKFRLALTQKTVILNGYADLRDLHEQRAVFAFAWPQVKPNRLLATMGTQLATYRIQLEEWRGTLSTRIQEELIRLNHKTVLEELPVSSTIEPLEQELEVFIDEVNASGLYQLPFQSKTLTLARQQKYLEEIIDQLERSQDGLSQYVAFYHWQRNWFSLSEIARKTIQALLRSRPDDWQAAFTSWYFNESLLKKYRPFPVLAKDLAREYTQGVQQIRAQLSQVVNKDWEARRSNALGQLKPALRQWPNQATELLATYGHPVAQFKPVALANPEQAVALAAHYDLLILENAQTLASSELVPVLPQARQVVAFADPDQRGIVDDDVVGMLEKGQIVRQRYSDEEAIRLPSYFQQHAVKVNLHQLDGRFDENSLTNEVEALELLKLLNTIEKKPQQTYPKVGIIALNIAQRDLILQLLYRIKRERSPGAELIQQLERNGLEVLHGSDPVEQSFEVLFVSTVFGTIDYQGHLSPLMAMLNQPYYHASLKIIEAALQATHEIHWLNSLPLDELRVRATWADRQGEQLLAKLVFVLQAKANNNAAELEHWNAGWFPVLENKHPHALANELVVRLGQQLPDWEWSLEVPSGISQEVLVAHPPLGKAVVLLTDGFVSQYPQTTHDWEVRQQDQLLAAGYAILPFSTEQLWKDPTRTCHRLVSQLTGLAVTPQKEA